jgi:2-polyprenyl-6-methoxyphenol hydroxylase-like FAD-dependent oxidoreductase
VLLTGLEDAVQFGAAFTRLELRADGTVRAWFADGRIDTADVLVGADGIGSAVRRQYLPHVRVVDTGMRMLMGATPLRALAGSRLPGLIGHSPAGVDVRGTTVALAVLRFTQAPRAARDRWLPTLRAQAVTEAEDYIMWALLSTAEQLGSAGSPAIATRRAGELAADLHPTLRQVVYEAWPDVTATLRIGSIPPMPAWPTGPVTVIGDAIHLAPGFGGNLAMQDAHRLRDALVDAAAGQHGLLAAIGAYEDAMRRENFPTPDAVGGLPRTAPGPRGAVETGAAKPGA